MRPISTPRPQIYHFNAFTVEHEGLRARMDWERGRVFENEAGLLFHDIVNSEKSAQYVVYVSGENYIYRLLALRASHKKTARKFDLFRSIP